MLSYITEPLRKLFSQRDAEPYKRKRSKASMTPECEEGEPSSKRFQKSPSGGRKTSSNHRKTSYLSANLPFGNCIQDWIAKIGQMAAKPIMPINFGHVRDADDLTEDEPEDQKDEDDDSDIEIIEMPPHVNGKDNPLSQVLTREPLHADHNTHGKKTQQDKWHDANEESDGTEDSDVMVLPTPQNGSGSVHNKKAYQTLEEDQSEDSSLQSSEPSFFKKYCGRSSRYLKAKTPLEPIRLGEKEQYRMLLEQCKVGSQVESSLEKSKHFSFQMSSSVQQRESLKHGVSVTKLSPFSRQGLVDRLGSNSDQKDRGAAHKGNGVLVTKDRLGSNHKYSSLWSEPSPSGSIMNKTHPKQLDTDVSLRLSAGKQLHNHREPLPSVSGMLSISKGAAVRPKETYLERRSSLPSFDKPKFSKGWLNDLQMSLDDCCKYRAEKEEKLERITREMREKREAKIFAENRKSLNRLVKTLRLKSTDVSEEEEDKIHFPELTPEMERKVDEVLRPTPPEEVLCEGFRLSIARRDMETLTGLNWLNDEIINFYMNLLMERGKNDNFPSVYAFNTFFYPKLISGGHAALRRWTRQVDIFSYHYVLIPVHLGMHWCLAVIDFKQKKIQYYDSMGGQNNECVNALKSYLHDERKDKKKEEYDMTDWKFETVKNIPQQMNGSDCGMFTLKYAEYITRNAKITFSQRHMPYFRRRMVYEILTKNLL